MRQRESLVDILHSNFDLIDKLQKRERLAERRGIAKGLFIALLVVAGCLEIRRENAGQPRQELLSPEAQMDDTLLLEQSRILEVDSLTDTSELKAATGQGQITVAWDPIPDRRSVNTYSSSCALSHGLRSWRPWHPFPYPEDWGLYQPDSWPEIWESFNADETGEFAPWERGMGDYWEERRDSL